VTGYPWSEIHTPEHKRFRDAYQKRWKDYPRQGSVVGYTAVYSVANAMRKAKSADTEKLVEALKGLEMQTPFGPIVWRALDHQSTMGRVRRPARAERRQRRDGELALRRRRQGAALRSGHSHAEEGVKTAGLSAAAVLLQFLNGLAAASSLFLVASGLSLIFGVSRIVNFRARLAVHARHVPRRCGCPARVGFWLSVPLAAAAVGACGLLVEFLLLRRLYRAPELLQLLATFALVLVIKDFALWAWGAEDLLGPRAPGLKDAVEIAGRQFPKYDLFLIALGPAVFALLHFLLTRTRFGILIRAATEDREMTGAPSASTSAGCSPRCSPSARPSPASAGARPIPARAGEPLEIDLSVVSDCLRRRGGRAALARFPGAFLACAADRGRFKAFCIGPGLLEITLVAPSSSSWPWCWSCDPWGLLGRRPREAARVPRCRSTLESSKASARGRRRARAGAGLFSGGLCARACSPTVLDALPCSPVSLHFLPRAGRHGVVRPSRPISGSALRAPRCSCCAPSCRWKPRCCSRPWPRWLAQRCSAGSACASPAFTSHAHAGVRADRLCRSRSSGTRSADGSNG
jgi:hypothetical protein